MFYPATLTLGGASGGGGGSDGGSGAGGMDGRGSWDGGDWGETTTMIMRMMIRWYWMMDDIER